MVTKIFKKNSKTKVFSLLFMLLSLSLCISLAGIFSSIITVGGFSNITSNDVKCSAFSVYALSLYQSQTKTGARELSEIVMRKNGAGYIYQTQDAYHILASCYENKSDAENVAKTLTESDIAPTILQLNFDEIQIKCKLTDQEKTTLNKALSSHKNLYKKLYDLSVSIDTNLYSEIQSKVLLSDIISDQQKIQTTFETLFNSKLTSSLLEIKLSLSSLSTILQTLADFSSTTIPYTSQVKNSYFSVLSCYLSLTQKL